MDVSIGTLPHRLLLAPQGSLVCGDWGDHVNLVGLTQFKEGGSYTESLAGLRLFRFNYTNLNHSDRTEDTENPEETNSFG